PCGADAGNAKARPPDGQGTDLRVLPAGVGLRAGLPIRYDYGCGATGGAGASAAGAAGAAGALGAGAAGIGALGAAGSDASTSVASARCSPLATASCACRSSTET